MSRQKILSFSVIVVLVSSISPCVYGQDGGLKDSDNPYGVSKGTLNELAELHFKLGDVYLDIYRAGDASKSESFNNAITNYRVGLALAPDNVYYHNRLAYAYHLERRLKEASEEYAKVLELVPPREVSKEELALVLKYAPRVYTNPNEFFELEDVTVILHPDKPLIEYSFFWDDDGDYPEDNDPTDHEKVWIEYDPESGGIVNVFAYFHRAVLMTKEAVEDARKHDNRARFNIQWNGHGSLPLGWENIPVEDISVTYAHIETAARIKDMVTRYNEHVQSTRMPNHPLAKNWPKKFNGSWEEYTTFSKYIDLPKMIKEKNMVIKSRWSNAAIDQYFLDYQFYPKIDWPKDVP
jgi:tetratricopeptide (TPR) repeat protein